MATSTLTGQRLTSGEVAPQGPTPAAGPGRPVRPRPPSSAAVRRSASTEVGYVNGCSSVDVVDMTCSRFSPYLSSTQIIPQPPDPSALESERCFANRRHRVEVAQRDRGAPSDSWGPCQGRTRASHLATPSKGAAGSCQSTGGTTVESQSVRTGSSAGLSSTAWLLALGAAGPATASRLRRAHPTSSVRVLGDPHGLPGTRKTRAMQASGTWRRATRSGATDD